jgi:3-methyl-2-oxobutanoate hydroxymethyltransferase
MKKSILNFKQMKKKGEPITWITAYSYPMAQAAEKAGVEMILVGDSGGMVELGYQTTNPVTMDEMIQLAKAARKGAPNTFIVGDMPQGSYEVSDEEAIKNAMRFVKEAGCDAIKLEGGLRMSSRIQAISKAGIVVIGHLGLTPQSTASFGGYRVQGKTIESFEETIKEADNVMDYLIPNAPITTPINILTGLNKLFSGFEKPIIKASKLYNVEYSSLIFELGNRKLVAGQEDLILEVAQKLKNK